MLTRSSFCFASNFFQAHRPANPMVVTYTDNEEIVTGKKLEAKQNDDIVNMKTDIKDLSDNINDSMRTIQRDMLRLQIITGINSGRLSMGEVTMLYDKYKDNGGNSYITRVVNDYLEEELDAKRSK